MFSSHSAWAWFRSLDRFRCFAGNPLKAKSLPATGGRGRLAAKPVIETLEDRTLLSLNAPIGLPAGQGPEGIAVADFTGSGIQDIIVTNEGPGVGGTISVLLGNGDGTFQAPITFIAS